MDIHFDCTQCGRCCHNLKLPLSVDEAIRWAGRGHQVQLLCEAHAADEVPIGIRERYRHDRAFEGASGSVQIRVSVILVAAFDGACPHLRPDMLCGNYEERPRVCRIYPAETTPDIELLPDRKACPGEAWESSQPLYQRNKEVMDEMTRTLIVQHRAAALADVPVKKPAVARLGISTAAFGNEGYVVHAPDPARLSEALAESQASYPANGDWAGWVIMTNRRSTQVMLEGAGAVSDLVSDAPSYIGFFSEDSW